MILNEKNNVMKPASDLVDPRPMNEVSNIINLLANYYQDGDLGSREDLIAIFQKMQAQPEDCTVAFEKNLTEVEVALLDRAPNFRAIDIQLNLFSLTIAHCVEAMRPAQDSHQQWWRICWAHNCLGRLHGSILGDAIGGGMAISGKAKAGAAARHKENHDMKIIVFKWLDENMVNYKSLDSAAKIIAEKIVPVAFRTARSWAGEWKKLRSASKP